MFGLSEERYQYLHDTLKIEDYALKRFIDLYGVDGVEHGYYFSDKSPYSGSNVIPGAMHLVCIPESFNRLLHEGDAYQQAVKDGIQFINDMPGLQKGFYLDTPGNRQICANTLVANPELRIENWINLKSIFGRNYAAQFPDILEAVNQQKVGKYLIEDQITVKGTTYVMGHNPNAPSPYATWRKDGENSYVTGTYHHTEAEARKKLFSRAMHELPELEKSDILLSNLTLDDKEVIHKQQRDAVALSTMEFALSDAAEDLGYSKQELDDMLDNPGFKKDIIEAYHDIDKTFDEGLLFDKLQEIIQEYFPQKQATMSEPERDTDSKTGLDQQIQNAKQRAGTPGTDKQIPVLEK